MVDSKTLAACSGLAFLILPCHSEAVSWISGRTDLVATFLCLCSFGAYLLYMPRMKARFLLLSLILFAASLFAKESVIVFPLLLLLYAVQMRSGEAKESRLKQVAELGAWHFLVLAGYLVVRQNLLGSLVGGYGAESHLRYGPIILIKGLLSFSSRALIPPMPNKIFPILIFLVIVLAAAARLYSRRAELWFSQEPIMKSLRKLLFFFPVAFFIALVPVVNLGISKTDTQGERLLYLPSVFAVIGIVVLLRMLIARRRNFLIILAGLLLTWTTLLVRSNSNWRQAGEISHSIVTSLNGVVADDRLLIVNLPDNFRGAYLFRNGIGAAARLFSPQSSPQDIKVISYHSLFAADEKILVERRGNKIRVELSDPRGYFMNANVSVEMTFHTADYEIRNFQSDGYDLLLKGEGPKDRVVFFSNGKINPLQP